MAKNETGYGIQRRADAAFTITEVVIGMVLMVISLSLLLSAFVSSKSSVTLAQDYLTALRLACSHAEQLQTNSYADIVSTNLTVTNELIAYGIDRVVTAVSNRYEDITIVVEWIEPRSSRRQALTNYMTICNTN